MRHKQTLAIVTMAYNEELKLPRWINHYLKQTSDPTNIFILDHGTNDGSTSNLDPINVVNVVRESDFRQTWRSEYVSEFANKLLNSFKFVIYTDVDEILVADPARFESLQSYLEVEESPCQNAIGFDVLHDLPAEADLHSGPVLLQRRKLQLVAAMCKPVVASQKVKWTSGFHCANIKPSFGDLYLFHLRYADIREGLMRLSITRKLDRSEMAGVPVDHQKISDDLYVQWVKSWSSMPLFDLGIGMDCEYVREFINSIYFEVDVSGIYLNDYSFRSDRLLAVPVQFHHVA